MKKKGSVLKELQVVAPEVLKCFRFSRAYPKEERRNTKLMLAGKGDQEPMRTNRIV